MAETMRRQLQIFIFRWVMNSVGLWIAVRLLAGLGAQQLSENTILTFLAAGLVFSLVNALVRPIVLILSLPAILLSLGIFMLVVNGLMVYITALIVPGIDIPFEAAIVASLVMSLINYVITGLLDVQRPERKAPRNV